MFRLVIVAFYRLQARTSPEIPPGGRDLHTQNWNDGRYLETFSGFVGFCFQIASDSDCRVRSEDGIMEGGGWEKTASPERKLRGGVQTRIRDMANGKSRKRVERA